MVEMERNCCHMLTLQDKTDECSHMEGNQNPILVAVDTS